MIHLKLPVEKNELQLQPGDFVELSGMIYCGRDAVLPHVVRGAEDGTLQAQGIDLKGKAVFHTAVSDAGIAPTTSSKPEIEGSVVPLAAEGVVFHIGKGLISRETIKGLKQHHSYFLIVPPVAALLQDTIVTKRAVLHPEFGMEAFYEVVVENFPAIVAVANGESMF